MSGTTLRLWRARTPGGRLLQVGGGLGEGRDEPRWTPEFLGHRIRSQQSVEEDVNVLRDRIEAILKFCRRTHNRLPFRVLDR